MSFIPEITCSHCGTKYSALRGRCPNCGTRHVKQTSRSAAAAAGGDAPAGGNAAATAQWQLIFGGILIVAVIVAVIILITASLNPSESGTGKTGKSTTTETPNVSFTPEPTPTPTPTPTPSPTVAVTGITIFASYDSSNALTDFSMRIGDTLTVVGDVYPTDARTTAVVTWRSTDENVFTVDENGLITAIGSGNAELIAECGGAAQKCIVRVH